MSSTGNDPHASCDRQDITRAAITQPIGVVVVIDNRGVVLAISENHISYTWVRQQVNRNDIGVVDYRSLFHDKIVSSITDGVQCCMDDPAPKTRTHIVDIFFSHVTYVTILLQADKTLVIEIEDFDRNKLAIHPIVDTSNVIGKMSANVSVEGTVNDLCSCIFERGSYDRAMTYRFLDDLSGEVVYELKNDDKVPSSFLGLRFPAGDIPLPARKAYVQNSVRFIADVESSSYSLIEGDTRVALTQSYLRGCVEVHKRYLRTMGVVSSLSIAIVSMDNRLWGLIALHSYSQPVIPTIEERVSYKILATVASNHVQHIEYSDRVERKAELETLLLSLTTSVSLGVFVVANEARLLRILKVDAISVFTEDRVPTAVGNIPVTLEELPPRDHQSIYYGTIDNPPRSFACLKINDVVIVFTRVSAYKAVNWAGNPGEVDNISPDMVMPRKSFDTYMQHGFRNPPVIREDERVMFQRVHEACSLYLYKRKVEQAQDKVNQAMMESQLVEMKSEKDYSFFANMSHELRTPLHAIGGLFDIMLDIKGENEADSMRYYSKIGLKTCREMLRTLNDILFIVRKTHEIGTVKACEIIVKELFESTASGFRVLSAKHGIAFNMSFLCNLNSIIRVDVRKAVQIFNNICGNAIKFTARNGKVDVCVDLLRTSSMVSAKWDTLSAKYRDLHTETKPGSSIKEGELKQWLVFTVEDTGCGVAEEDMPRMFQKFHQVNDVVTKAFSSTGLGLYITQSDVKTLGGFLSVASTLSVGTLFLCAFPVEPVETNNLQVEEEKAMESKDPTRGFASEEVVFLVVDDSKVNVMVAKKQIERAFENATVHTAVNGKLAVEELGRLRGLGVQIDGIFMDYHMPVMSGLEATRQIRSKFPDTKLPVTMLTADITELSRQSMMSCGIDFVLTKPSKPEQVVNMCVKMIQLNGRANKS